MSGCKRTVVTFVRVAETGRFDPFDNDIAKLTLAWTDAFERRLTETSASAHSRPVPDIRPHDQMVTQAADPPSKAATHRK